MEVLSVYRGARISAFKARELTREIQGLPASDALDLIAFSTKKAALMVGKTLKSAIANAENNNSLRVNTLVVKEATVGEGPTMKRIKSRARGSASPIRKRTAHIRIVLTDDIVIPEPRTSTKNKKKKTGQNARGAAVAGTRAQSASQTPVATQEDPAHPDVDVTGVSGSEVASTAGTAQPSEGPGETASAPKLSSDEDETKA